jgi:hypothetical protein
MDRSFTPGILGATVVAGSAILSAYQFFVRPWQLRWGATDVEVVRPMPGDEIVKRPTFNATRAVTIRAQPEEIWPWIVQIGMNRAGWYSYDLLDNLKRPSAWDVLPQFQSPKIGDVIPISPDEKHGPYVKDFDPERWMLWWDGKDGMSWAWGLYPVDETHTRLITRVHIRYKWLSPEILFDMLVEFTDIIMMRKMLLGIKKRAERTGHGTGGRLKPKARR